MESAPGCPDANALLAFVDGEADELRAHIQSCPSCQRVVALADDDSGATGATRFGRYEVVRTIGAGGMGVVYEARDPELDRPVALKVVRLSAERRDLVEREAESMARLRHPNVVQIYDVGVREEQVFFAMELIDGETLDVWAHGKSVEAIVDALAQVADGVTAAHAAGIVHRDLKPANILVANDGRVVVTDFGLARLGSSEHSKTPVSSDDDDDAPLGATRRTYRGAGTLPFMAPEQHRLGTEDARTDVFALCVSAYQVLFGVMPFQGQNSEQLLAEKLQADIAAPRINASERRLLGVIHRGLDASPLKRHASMAAFRADLTATPRSLVPIALGVGAVAFVGFTLAFAWRDAEPPPVCNDDGLDGAWWAARPALDTAFGETELAHAADAWRRFATGMDAYAQTWTSERAEVCDGELSQRAQEQRARCLETASAAGHSLLEAAAAPDSALLAKIGNAVEQLPSPLACAERSAPDSDVVAEIRNDLERVRTLEAVARNVDAEAAADAVLRRVAASEHPGLHADALALRGRMRALGDQPANGLEDLEAAFLMATKAGDDEVAARAAVDLTTLLGTVLMRPDDAQEWARHAKSAAERAGNPPRGEWALLRALAELHLLRGDAAAARANAEEALALMQATLGPTHGDVGVQQYNVARTLIQQGKLDEARSMGEAALAIVEAARGSKHPHAASLEQGLASIAWLQSDFDSAGAHFERAREIVEGSVGATHPDVLSLNINIAMLAAARGDFAKALELMPAAVAAAEATLGPEHPYVAGGLEVLGAAQLQLGDPAAAQETYARVLKIREQNTPTDIGLSKALNNLGSSLAAQDRIDEAAKYFERALAKAKQAEGLGDAHAAEAIYNLAGVALAREQPALAKKHAARALELWTAAGTTPKIPQAKALVERLEAD